VTLNSHVLTVQLQIACDGANGCMHISEAADELERKFALDRIVRRTSRRDRRAQGGPQHRTLVAWWPAGSACSLTCSRIRTVPRPWRGPGSHLVPPEVQNGPTVPTFTEPSASFRSLLPQVSAIIQNFYLHI
jgi:hypothetical protein